MHCDLSVKVIPGASREGVAGWLGDELKVKVTAPPDKGKANIAVCALLAGYLGLPVGSVTVLRGHASPHKRLRIDGLDANGLKEQLGKLV